MGKKEIEEEIVRLDMEHEEMTHEEYNIKREGLEISAAESTVICDGCSKETEVHSVQGDLLYCRECS
tara:strand:- start:5282 stop:5482 length:201 start_codon:yes stop_codon:yes gene_type:complete